MRSPILLLSFGAVIAAGGCTTPAVRSSTDPAHDAFKRFDMCGSIERNCPVSYYNLARSYLVLTVGRKGELSAPVAAPAPAPPPKPSGDEGEEEAGSEAQGGDGKPKAGKAPKPSPTAEAAAPTPPKKTPCQQVEGAFAETRTPARIEIMKAVAKARRDQATVLTAPTFDSTAAAKVITEFDAARAKAVEAADQLTLMQADYTELCWPALEYRVDLVTRFDGRRVGLMLGQDIFAGDKLKVETADGGLAKITFASDDQSVAAARDLVKTIATAPISLDFSALNMVASPKAVIPPAIPVNFFVGKGGPKFLGIVEFSEQGVVIPNGPPRDEFVRWRPVDVPMPPLNKGPFPAPLKREMRLSTIDGTGGISIAEAMRVLVDDSIVDITFGFNVTVDCGSASGAGATTTTASRQEGARKPGAESPPPPKTETPPTPPQDTPANGVWMSSRKTCDFSIYDLRFQQVPRETLSAQIFDDRRLEFAPVLRTRFTTRGTTYQFTNGLITTAEIDSPSPGASLAKGALEVVTAPISAVSTAIQGQQGMLDAETKRIEAETALIDAQRKLAAARKGETPEEEEQEDSEGDGG